MTKRSRSFSVVDGINRVLVYQLLVAISVEDKANKFVDAGSLSSSSKLICDCEKAGS
jgi:hypothetical protein